MAIFLFEHQEPNDGKTYLTFFDEKNAFVIEKSGVDKFILNSLIKGLTYKVSLPCVPSSSVKVAVPSLGGFTHLTASKIQVPLREDYSKAPYFLCRVSESNNSSDYANIQLLKVRALNIQIPYKVIPSQLGEAGDITIKLAFTARTVRLSSNVSRRLPSIETGFFTHCDGRGNDVPAPKPKFALATGDVKAVKEGFLANFVIGVPNGDYDFLTASDSNLLSWRVNKSTSARELLESALAHLKSQDPSTSRDSMIQYFDKHFGVLLKNGRGWGSSSSSSSSSSPPTFLFFIGLSDVLTVQVAEAIGLDAHRNFGINCRIVTPAARGSNGENFSELNSARASPFLSKRIFQLSSPLQLGLLNGDEYLYNDPELFTPFMAYDVFSDLQRPPTGLGPIVLPTTNIEVSGVAAPDTGYLTDPDQLFGLFVAFTDSSSRNHKILEEITASGAKHVPILDFTGRSSKWVSVYAMLHTEKQRTNLQEKLVGLGNVVSMLPAAFLPIKKDTLTLQTTNAISLGPNVIVKVLSDARVGIKRDQMFFTSNSTVKITLPDGLDQRGFSILLQKFNRSFGSECFSSTCGALGVLDLCQLDHRTGSGPYAPWASLNDQPGGIPSTKSFMVTGPLASSGNDLILATVLKLGASNPRRVLRNDRRSELVLDWPSLTFSGELNPIPGVQGKHVLAPFVPLPGDVPFPIKPMAELGDLFTSVPLASISTTALPSGFEKALASLDGGKAPVGDVLAANLGQASGSATPAHVDRLVQSSATQEAPALTGDSHSGKQTEPLQKTKGNAAPRLALANADKAKEILPEPVSGSITSKSPPEASTTLLKPAVNDQNQGLPGAPLPIPNDNEMLSNGAPQASAGAPPGPRSGTGLDTLLEEAMELSDSGASWPPVELVTLPNVTPLVITKNLINQWALAKIKAELNARGIAFDDKATLPVLRKVLIAGLAFTDSPAKSAPPSSPSKRKGSPSSTSNSPGSASPESARQRL